MTKTHQIIHYQTIEGSAAIEVNLHEESVWLSQKQMAQLFDRDYKTISKHIRNVFKEGELDQNSTVANFATVQTEGDRQVEREIAYYNLDVIISVGYRVKSKRGTNFRIWATQVLRNYLLENAKRKARAHSYEDKYFQLVKTIDIAASTASTKDLSSSEARGILKVLRDYSYALQTLDKYDHQTLSIDSKPQTEIQKLTYEEAIGLIHEWRELEGTGKLFGNEKDDSFKSSLSTIYQTADGRRQTAELT